MNYIHKSLYFWELFCNFGMRSINPYKIYSYDGKTLKTRFCIIGSYILCWM